MTSEKRFKVLVAVGQVGASCCFRGFMIFRGGVGRVRLG
jgi:hypothetical protein